MAGSEPLALSFRQSAQVLLQAPQKLGFGDFSLGNVEFLLYLFIYFYLSIYLFIYLCIYIIIIIIIVIIIIIIIMYLFT